MLSRLLVISSWKLETGNRVGTWTSINGGLDNTTDGGEISLPVFLLEAVHGTEPAAQDFVYTLRD